LFDTYAQVWKGKAVSCDDQSPIHNRLRLAGIVKRVDGRLQVRNELYRRVFDWNWIKANRPTFWTQANKRLVWTTLTSLLVALVIAILAFQLNEQRKVAVAAQQELAVSLDREKKALEQSKEQRSKAERAERAAQLSAEESNKTRTVAERSATEARRQAVAAERAERAAQLSAEESNKTRTVAESSAAEARRQAIAARGGELAAGAASALAFGAPDRALLLARYAHETTPSNPLVAQATWLVLDNTRTRHILRGHEGSVRSAVFSADGRRVVTASDDNTARVWDAGKGALIKELGGEPGWVLSAVFSADGRRGLTATSHRTTRTCEP